jgi:hypothetical protein
MNAMARDFADGFNHVFSGCIGAFDGWIVKIWKPCKSDGVMDQENGPVPMAHQQLLFCPLMFVAVRV